VITRHLLVIVLAVGLAGCARTIRFQPHPPAVATPPAAAPVASPARPGRLIVGESLSYSILWLGLEVMRGELRVADAPAPAEGRSSLTLSATARSTGLARTLFSVEDTLSAVVDPQTVLPVRFEFTLRHGATRMAEVITFDRARGLAVSTRHAEPLAVPPDTRDLLTTYYHLRTVDVAEGQTLAGEFVAQGRRWPLTAVVHRRGTLTIPRGVFPAWEVEVQTPWLEAYLHHRTLWLWVSDDAAHVPLLIRMKFPLGWLTALLDDCRPAWPANSPCI